MFARAASTFVLALPLLAAATILPRGGGCDTGSLTCCQSTVAASNPGASVTTLLGLLGIVTGDLTGLIGLTCTANVNCNQQAVCCTNDSFNGLVAIGCTPVNVNL